MSITELLPSIATLSHAEKFQLAQIVLQQLAQEDGIMISSNATEIARLSESVLRNAWDNEEDTIYDHKKSLRGCLKHYAKPELIDLEKSAWQDAVKEKYEHS